MLLELTNDNIIFAPGQEQVNIHPPILRTRDIHNHHMNSRAWDAINFRPDDIVISTYAKSGTTWMQQIVSQLIFKGQEGLNVSAMSPWVDLRIMPPEAIAALDQQPHRRFLKTHLPVDALRFSPEAKYLYVARDGRDVVWSLYNHHINANQTWYDALNNTPGRVGPAIGRPPEDVVTYFTDWLEGDGAPFWSFWENVRSWWTIRELPNVKMVHFNDLKRDLEGSVRSIAHYLEIDVDKKTFQKVMDHCSFAYMKEHAEQAAPLGGALWEGGAKTFINKGTNGRWKDILPAELSAAYEARARSELGEACAAWLKDGGSVR